MSAPVRPVHRKLRDSWRRSGSMLCVGLDPDADRLPDPIRGRDDALLAFCTEIVDATADLVCAFKPQFAHFAVAARRAPARAALPLHPRRRTRTCCSCSTRSEATSARRPSTTRREAFDRYGADMVTVSPYLGLDSVEPYLRYDDRGVFVLCRTSNPGSGELPVAAVVGDVPLYEHVARRVATEWSAIGACGLVVGATYPDELRRVRAIVGDLPILVPGIGAQGGDIAATVAAGVDSAGYGMVVSSSRADPVRVERGGLRRRGTGGGDGDPRRAARPRRRLIRSACWRAPPQRSARLAPMRAAGVHHVSINVDDVDAAVRFYTDVLGLAMRDDRPDFPFGGAWLDVGGQQVHLIEAPVPDDRGQHFALHVGDLDAAIEELRARGVRVSDAQAVGTGRQAFLRDPAGNRVELQQPGG